MDKERSVIKFSPISIAFISFIKAFDKCDFAWKPRRSGDQRLQNIGHDKRPGTHHASKAGYAGVCQIVSANSWVGLVYRILQSVEQCERLLTLAFHVGNSSAVPTE